VHYLVDCVDRYLDEVIEMRIFLMALCIFLSGSTSGFPSQNAGSEALVQAVSNDFIIGLEDILSINVWKEPELSVKEVIVRPDGKISIPLVGDVQASGLTPMQLQEQITERMREFVSSPNVTVVVLKIASRSVSIVGEVNRPGIYYLGSRMTVLELLARAGGLKENAKEKDISVVRTEGNRSIRFPFNYKDVSKGKNLKQNIALKNGDVVIVP
jgi:polysaccharide export outer membrane protein